MQSRHRSSARPAGNDPHHSYSEITFYSHAGMQAASWESAEAAERNAVERAQGFADVIQAEDYWAAASSHKGLCSGAQEYVLFGRNEPALHHYHNTYRDSLRLPLLPLE